MDAGEGRTLWPYREARAIVERFEEQEEYLLQTGFGPSGAPHIGTFGEVVRTHYVRLALQEMGHPSRLVCFSDDLDGLKDVPKGMPGWLGEYLGKPLSSIPDPYACCDSYAGHMNGLLCRMLDDAGIPYVFRSATKVYPFVKTAGGDS